ncbi:hypothetical protein HRG84_07675 [Flavisolibacter sp. BT320]|nr:hypothetical protein [Flavisolibacter longurius]
MSINKDSIVFQFMLKEYEKLYAHFDMHYQAVERSINFYFVLIGAVISFNGLVYNKENKIVLFSLAGTQLMFLLILCVLGCLVYFKVIEHRLLIIAYVKSLNLNRKWFLENSEDRNLEQFMYFKAGVSSPPFYKKFRHFYWEAAGLALINSIFISLLLINIFKKCFYFQSQNSDIYNGIYLIVLSTTLAILHLVYYKIRGTREEVKVKKRFENKKES